MLALKLFMRVFSFKFLFLLFFSCFWSASHAFTVYRISIDTAVGPASHDFLDTSIQIASGKNADALLIELNTPGGLVTSMREMALKILNAPMPVIVYVSPSGSQAASAGAFLVYAAHVAAMAPGTNIGASLPVSLIGEDSNLPAQDPPKPPLGVDQTTEQLEATEGMTRSYQETKTLEDLSAFMRALAQKNDRNEELGVSMVTRGKSFTAQEALSQNIINFMSPSIDRLLDSLHGLKVEVKGNEVVLDTKNAVIIDIQPNWRNQFLSILTDPNITYILLLIGVYGVLLEFYSPGALYPGVIGGICLILAGYSLHLLPVSFAGLGLLVLGIVFLVFESITPSYGIFGVGGLIAFIFGSIFLLDTTLPGYSIAPSVIGSMAILTMAFFLAILRFVVGALTTPVVSGSESLIGRSATVLEPFHGYGSVTLEGNIYRAYSERPLSAQDSVEIYEVRGITLYVKPVSPSRRYTSY